jgi:hypothetical protein
MHGIQGSEAAIMGVSLHGFVSRARAMRPFHGHPSVWRVPRNAAKEALHDHEAHEVTRRSGSRKWVIAGLR